MCQGRDLKADVHSVPGHHAQQREERVLETLLKQELQGASHQIPTKLAARERDCLHLKQLQIHRMLKRVTEVRGERSQPQNQEHNGSKVL